MLHPSTLRYILASETKIKLACTLKNSRKSDKRQRSSTITFNQKRESSSDRSYLHSIAWNFIMILINAKSDEKEKKEGKRKSGFVFSRKGKGEGYNE